MCNQNKSGVSIIEEALNQASKLDPNNSPFPMVGDAAIAYQMGLVAAYQHALEMMGSSLKKIVIHQVGGNVDYVCSDDPNVVVVLHDSDNLDGDGVGAEERTSIFDKASKGCKQVSIVDSRELTGSGVPA